MPQPLDYRNPKAPREPSQQVEPTSSPPQAIPIEFDTLLTQTDDHAAVGAIEAALRRAKIEYFVMNDHQHPVELHIRSRDQQRAAQIASEIFVRRQKIKKFPKVEIPPDDPPRILPFGGMF